MNEEMTGFVWLYLAEVTTRAPWRVRDRPERSLTRQGVILDAPLHSL